MGKGKTIKRLKNKIKKLEKRVSRLEGIDNTARNVFIKNLHHIDPSWECVVFSDSDPGIMVADGAGNEVKVSASETMADYQNSHFTEWYDFSKIVQLCRNTYDVVFNDDLIHTGVTEFHLD